VAEIKRKITAETELLIYDIIGSDISIKSLKRKT
jgi:hypothetical protein